MATSDFNAEETKIPDNSIEPPASVDENPYITPAPGFGTRAKLSQTWNLAELCNFSASELIQTATQLGSYEFRPTEQSEYASSSPRRRRASVIRVAAAPGVRRPLRHGPPALLLLGSLVRDCSNMNSSSVTGTVTNPCLAGPGRLSVWYLQSESWLSRGRLGHSLGWSDSTCGRRRTCGPSQLPRLARAGPP